MFRIHTLLVALLLAAVAASAIRPSAGLEPFNRELDTAIRHGSHRYYRGSDDRMSLEKPVDSRWKGRDAKSRGGPQRGKNNDTTPRKSGNRKDDSDENKNPHARSDGFRNKGREHGKEITRGRGIGPVRKCDPWDSDCRESKRNENLEQPGIPGRKNNGDRIRRRPKKNPKKRDVNGKGRSPGPVRKCDPWNHDCDMGADDDGLPCDPWDPECGEESEDEDDMPCDPWDPECEKESEDDDDMPCDPWDPECGKESEEDDPPLCDPWKEDCKTKATFPRGKGSHGRKRRRRNMGSKAQDPIRRGNGVKRRRGSKKHMRRNRRSRGHSHSKEGGHSPGNKPRKSNRKRKHNSRRRKNGTGGKYGTY